LILVPEGQMNAMGEQSFKEILDKEKVSTNTKLNEIVSRIGKRIADASGKDFAWEFKVFEDDEMINAFCLPGGKVGVYTGMIKVAQNEAALAAVIGHEVAHATLRHGNERVSQAVALEAGLSIASLSFENAKHRQIIMAGLGLGAQVGVLLPYSRRHETEADTVGLRYMAKAGYDPREAPRLWERMAQLGGNGPEFLSTHPNPSRRAKELEAQLEEVQELYESSSKQPSRSF
jgi:metalloendopeptidase OMA1, mitochondrial